jgi:hypothetical protein
MKKEAREKDLSSIGIRVLGIKKIRDMGMSAFFSSTNEIGISVVSVYGKPQCMVMPLSVMGTRKTIQQLEALLHNGVSQDEISVSVQYLLDSMQYLLNDARKILDSEEYSRSAGVQRDRRK